MGTSAASAHIHLAIPDPDVGTPKYSIPAQSFGRGKSLVHSLDLGAPWDVVSLDLDCDRGKDQVLPDLAQ